MKQCRVMIFAAAALILTGCQQSPDSGFVVHKDMDNVIEQAADSEGSNVGIEEIKASTAKHYEKQINIDTMHISIGVNADVELPESGEVSVFRASQHRFTNAEIEQYCGVLVGDIPMYDTAQAAVETKREIEERIAKARQAYEENLSQMTVDTDVYVREHEQIMAQLEAQYNAAPEEKQFVPAELKMVKNADGAAQNPGNNVWEWRAKYEPEGETCSIMSADGTTIFCAENNPTKGNLVYFAVAPEGYNFMHINNANLDRLIECTARNVPEHFIDHFQHDGANRYSPIDGDACTLSQADAEEQAETLLSKLGIDAFTFIEGGRYAELLGQEYGVSTRYITTYILRYVRTIGGIPLRQDSGMKFAQNEESGDYTKYFWPREVIEIRVNDAGILSFGYYAPIDVTETIVERAQMKPFSEIQSTFESMAPIVCAREDEISKKVQISQVILGYSRISERDSFDTGLIVPVWGFLGTAALLNEDGTTMWDSENYYIQPQICINAIDGSVIDSTLGY